MTTLFRGIGWRIFFSFSTLLIGLTLIISFVALKFAQKTTADNASNELRVLSVTLSQQLQRYVKRMETGLKSLSANGGLLDLEIEKESPNRHRLEKFLDSKLGQLNLFEMLAVFDTSGLCVASTDRGWEGLVAQREYFFINGLSKFSFSEMFEGRDTGEKILLVSTPIDEGPDPKGVLVAQVKLSTIYDLMGQKLALSNNAEAFLIDSKLRFVTPSKNAPDELQQSHLAQTPLVQHLQDEFWVGRYQNHKGEEVLGTVYKSSGTQWYLVIERDFADIQNELSGIKRALFSATLALMFALILTTVFLTHSITRPIQNLVESAQRIAAGDLNRPVEIPKGVDEISFLATEFDKMRARVAASQGRLIERLEESEELRIESERLAAIGTLASSLAHEIRNPLNAMTLLLSSLERSGQYDASKQNILDSMRGEIARLDRLVNDILDYARPLNLQSRKFDIKNFVDKVVEFYAPVFERQKIKVRVDSPTQKIEISGDSDKLRQAMVNLIQNSIDAMPGGGELLIQITRHGETAKIVVGDTGIGIPEKSRGRLFDLFYTTKEKGTGLGLSTVRKIVDAHRGQVDIESAPNRGTKVTLTLPI